MHWDIFCRVIDNFGDIGVCWRVATQLDKSEQSVRLWVDDSSALSWMAGNLPHRIEIMQWSGDQAGSHLCNTVPGDVVVESFGCELPDAFVHQMTVTKPPTVTNRLWLNLEYLTAEPFAATCHRLPSPVMSGAGKGLVKYFYYPGFTHETGGLLREPGLFEKQQTFDPSHWLAQFAPAATCGGPSPLRISLFCYEPAALVPLLVLLQQMLRPVQLLVTAGRAGMALQMALNEIGGRKNGHDLLSILTLPYLSQSDFDCLLWTCDLNFVRGEDSLVRAIWARKPFVWQLYPQNDGAHFDKLDAFLTLCHPTPKERQWFNIWNGRSTEPIPSIEDLLFGQVSANLAKQLTAQTDLSTQLIEFAVEKTR